MAQVLRISDYRVLNPKHATCGKHPRQGVGNVMEEGVVNAGEWGKCWETLLSRHSTVTFSWTHCSYGNLHTLKKTDSVNMPTGSANWTQEIATTQTTVTTTNPGGWERGIVRMGGVIRGEWDKIHCI